MKAAVRRFLYAPDIDKAIEHVSSSCHQCALLHMQSKNRTAASSDAVGIPFAADNRYDKAQQADDFGPWKMRDVTYGINAT